MTNLGSPRASWLAVLVFAAFVPTIARAQRCQGCDDDTTAVHMHVLPALGLHVGTPEKVSAAAGIVVGKDWYRNGRDHGRNLALYVEPGLSAGRASLSYVSHGFGTFGSGYAIGPSVLRTWNDPWTVKPNVTYVGGDLTVWPIIFTGPRIGIFRRVAGYDPRRWFLSVDFGIGL